MKRIFDSILRHVVHPEHRVLNQQLRAEAEDRVTKTRALIPAVKYASNSQHTVDLAYSLADKSNIGCSVH